MKLVVSPKSWRSNARLWEGFRRTGLRAARPETAERFLLRPEQIEELERLCGFDFHLTEKQVQLPFLVVDCEGDLDSPRTIQALQNLKNVPVDEEQIGDVPMQVYAHDCVAFGETFEQQRAIEHFFNTLRVDA